MKIPEILLVETVQKPGSLASVLQVIADEQLVIEHLQSLRREQGRTLWEITVEVDEQANPHFYDHIDALPSARFVGKSDRVFVRHKGGKIRMQASLQINTKQILRDIYTPGVARVCLAIRDDPSKASLYTNRSNTVAVVTNGTAVVALAALLNALRRVERDLSSSTVGQVGLGAAGLGIARLLKAQGVKRLVGADLREDACQRLRELGGETATLEQVMAQSDVVVATTGVKGLIKPEWVRPGQIIFALSNPDAEIDPLVALERGAVFAADGKGINNVSGFPGLFKGRSKPARRASPTACWWPLPPRCRSWRLPASCCRIRSIPRRTRP